MIVRVTLDTRVQTVVLVGIVHLIPTALVAMQRQGVPATPTHQPTPMNRPTVLVILGIQGLMAGLVQIVLRGRTVEVEMQRKRVPAIRIRQTTPTRWRTVFVMLAIRGRMAKLAQPVRPITTRTRRGV